MTTASRPQPSARRLPSVSETSAGGVVIDVHDGRARIAIIARRNRLLGAWAAGLMGLTEEEEIVADGFAPQGYGAEGNEMFVTCGIGFSLLPARINAPPQLLTLELHGT